jgi:hypothetical protein
MMGDVIILGLADLPIHELREDHLSTSPGNASEGSDLARVIGRS